MRLPFRKLHCDGETITVKVIKDRSHASEGYGFAGSYYRNVIKVAPNMPTDLTRRTIFAELIHYCFERAGLRERYATTTEEFIIHEFEPWLSQVLAENPALREFLWPEGGSA
jgi:hypothetical protein